MGHKIISQAEARRLKLRVDELEQRERERNRAWSNDWPVGTHLGGITMGSPACVIAKCFAARQLGHAVVAVPDGNNQEVRFVAVRLYP